MPTTTTTNHHTPTPPDQPPTLCGHPHPAPTAKAPAPPTPLRHPTPAPTVTGPVPLRTHPRAFIAAPACAGSATPAPEALACPPRGHRPGFARIRPAHKSPLPPDRRAKNRTDSLRNIVQD